MKSAFARVASGKNILALCGFLAAGLTAPQADAAVLHTNLTLRYDNTVYGSRNGDILIEPKEPNYDDPDNWLAWTFDKLVSTDDVWGFPTVLADVRSGDRLTFKGSFYPPHEEVYDTDFGNGGWSNNCSLGAFDCDKFGNTWMNYVWVSNNVLDMGYGEYDSASAQLWAGGAFSIYEALWLTTRSENLSEDGIYIMYNLDYRITNFTVVSVNPVPVPATAALLPFGIAALAMVRRRKTRT